MTDAATVGLCALLFGALTWLLALSYFLGKHSGKVENLEASQAKRDEALQRIFAKLDALTLLVPHTCYQAERIARLEERTSRGEERTAHGEEREHLRNDGD